MTESGKELHDQLLNGSIGKSIREVLNKSDSFNNRDFGYILHVFTLKEGTNNEYNYQVFSDGLKLSVATAMHEYYCAFFNIPFDMHDITRDIDNENPGYKGK